MTQSDIGIVEKRLPTHRCMACEASWVKHGDGTWSLMSRSCGQCCDNAPMGGQMIPLAEIEAWEPAVKEFRRAASKRGMSDMAAFFAVRVICGEAPNTPDPAITEMVEALEEAREAIATLSPDELGTVMMPATGDGGNGYAYPIRDELLAKIDAALGRGK